MIETLHLTVDLDPDGDRIVTANCEWCGGTSRIRVDSGKYRQWMMNRRLIQDVWPSATLGDREALITGFHEPCFDAAFAEDEEDR